MDDGALLNAVGEGDPAALRELFELHATWLAVRLRRAIPDHAVEDVMQETFIAVWRGAKDVRRRGGGRRLDLGIARRKAAMWARSNGRPHFSLDDVTVDPMAPDDVEAVAVRGADLATAMTALGPAGSEGQELVRLVYVEDRPLNEVAEVLGIPTGTVKSRLFRARQVLRSALRGETRGDVSL